ncbi:Rrf2 family transcriptional regulator [Micromonospora sp. CPCC 205539]|uniref:Rrf2 family transcriptional regulator n=1 Tax=Micromonospora sp. CPCC 205539 TaxID=3122408 RepID=UPI002FF41F7A
MSGNSRLCVAVHVLTWMALDQRDPAAVATSQRLAVSVNTNPVVIRRCLGQLREAGLVQSRRGAGAGWNLTRAPEQITLLDVHLAVGDDEQLFALHHSPPSGSCPIGFGIQPALRPVFGRLDEAVRRELATTTIADMLRDVLAQQPATA